MKGLCREFIVTEYKGKGKLLCEWHKKHCKECREFFKEQRKTRKKLEGLTS